MGHPGYGPGGYQPDQPQQPQQPPAQPPSQPSWGETQQQPSQPAWGETQQQPTQPVSGGYGGGTPTSGSGYGAPQQPGPEFGPPPTSGAGGYAPGQAAPSHTMPMPQMGDLYGTGPTPPGAAPSSSGRSPWVMILAGTTALFFLVAVVLGGFLINTNNNLDATQKKLDRTVAADDMKDAEGDNKNLSDDKETISKCLKLLFEFIEAAGKNDKKTAERKLKELDAPCRDAQRLID